MSSAIGIRSPGACAEILLLVVTLLHFAPPAVRAQAQPTEGNTEAEATPTEAFIPIAQIAERAERTDNELRAIRARMAPDEGIATVTRDLPATADQVEQLRRDTTEQLASGLTPHALDDVQQLWLQRRDQFASWAQTISARAQVVEQDTQTLGELNDLWDKTSATAKAQNLPDAVLAPIRTVRAGIRDTQTQLRSVRDALLDTLGRVSSLQALAAEELAQLDLAEQRLRRDLFTFDGPPLLSVLPNLQREPPVVEALRTGVIHDAEILKAFARQRQSRVVLHLTLLVALLITTISQSRRPMTALSADANEAVQAILVRPISAGLVLALTLSWALYPYAPSVVRNLIAALFIIPMIRLFHGEANRRLRQAVMVLSILLLVSAVHRLLPPFAAAARLLLAVENLAAALWLFGALRFRDNTVTAGASGWSRARAIFGWSALVLLVIGIGGNFTGNVSLAIVLSDGILRSALAAVGLLATNRALEGLLVEFIGSRVARRSRAIANSGPSLQRFAMRTIRAAMVLAWVSLALSLFALLNPFVDAITVALAARLTVGAVSLSLGDLFVVALTVWISVLSARVIRAVLENDVLPRLSLPRGVPAAISAGANYAVLLVGVLFALSAAGFDPGRIALVAGALSVGIGFGLQNVVNNFVSGLILLLERPVQIGDVIEVGTMRGQVRRIGIRSSTIATFDGAEVIVPNANLISERVVNWTLSNHRRRIEIKVGVAYGSEPMQVLKVLEASAHDIDDVLVEPAPRAVFLGFGDSSLDFALRVWTNQQDVLGIVHSRVAVAMHDALRAAGIGIPFPRRDVHVKAIGAGIPEPSVDKSR